MKVILFDRKEKQIGRLIPDLVTPREIEDLNGLNRFIFTYPANAEWAEQIETGFYVAIQDLDNDWQLYEITKVHTDISGTQSILEVECDHVYYALDEMEYIALNIQGQSANSALSQVLAGTGWQPGVVQMTGTRTISTQPIKRLAALRQLEQSWECELHYRVQISGVAIHAKYVDMLIRRGSHTGKRYTFGRDLIGINLIVDKSNVVTALYGFGPVLHLPEDGEEGERLTLADVEWVKGQPAELYPGGPTASAPVDKPLGQLWIGDEDAREVYGRLDASTQQMVHVFDEYSSSAQSPQALAWETWRQLQKRVTPLWHAEATVAALEQVPGFEHERVRLGDTNYAILPDMQPIEGRVILIDRQRKSPDQTIIEMGNFRPVQSEADYEMKRHQKKVESRSAIWDRASAFNADRTLPTSVLDGVIDAAKNQLLAGGGSFVANGDGAWVIDTDSIDTALGAMRMVAYQGEAALLFAKRPSPILPWNVRVGATTEGFRIFAEEIIAGIIRGAMLEITSETYFAEGYDPSQKATPEDVAAVEYAANQQFNAVNLRVDEVEFNVSAVSTMVNSHGLRLSDAEAGITVNAQEITQRVRKDNVISEINQSAEAIRISANRVQITGETIFASGYDPSSKATPESVVAAIDAIEIGGRNLLLNSKGPWTNSSYAVRTLYFGDSIPVAGETYTITMKYSVGSDRTHLHVFSSGGWRSLVPFYESDKNELGVTSKTFIMAYATGRSPDDGYNYIAVYQMPSSGTSASTIEWIKLEKGNKPSDWTPAPEDPIELPQLGTTIIQGGFLRTDLIQAGSIAAEKLAVNDLSAISGWFSSLRAGVSGGARLELGQSGGPHLHMFDTGNKLRVSLLQDKLEFQDELERVGGTLKAFRDIETLLSIFNLHSANAAMISASHDYYPNTAFPSVMDHTAAYMVAYMYQGSPNISIVASKKNAPGQGFSDIQVTSTGILLRPGTTFGTVTIDGVLAVEGGSHNVGSIIVGSASNGSIRVRHIQGKGASDADMGPLFINHYNADNVTICGGGGRALINGTGLTVAGDIAITGASSGATNLLTVGAGANGQMRVRNVMGKQASNDNYGPLYIQEYSADNLFLCNGGGNVGIGGTPSYKLHVHGDIMATGVYRTMDSGTLRTGVNSQFSVTLATGGSRTLMFRGGILVSVTSP